jgi:hypothetical protein
LQTDDGADAEIGVGGNAAGFEQCYNNCYNKLSVAVADEEDLLAAKHASLRGIPAAAAAATVCSKKGAKDQQQQQLLGGSDDASDDFLVVLCGEDSTISIVNGAASSSSSSSGSPSGKSEILSGCFDE